MNVLLVGSGGREHALAWKLAQSPRLSNLYITPGNAGTESLGVNLSIPAEDASALVAFCRSHAVDLVVVGPEAPLAAGLADELRAAGVPVFGPSQAAAQIEASKTFAKDFMVRHGIPTARHAVFQNYADALSYVEATPGPLVIKASGLAAGKGVLLPDTLEEARAALKEILVDAAFGAAGSEVVIEERLEGEEVSLLAFSDGTRVCAMPPAQDHKRLLDGDCGPNTGGMGAYAPAPVCPPALAQELTQSVLQRAVDGLRADGRPFVGVLYAGFMLTPNGPSVLEFNCRFGDPETQVILPLLDSDLLEIVDACANGRLDPAQVRWKPGAAACVVLAAGGYPVSAHKGMAISGLESDSSAAQNAVVFHAGTSVSAGKVVVAGGRVLNVTAWGEDLPAALRRAYAAVDRIHFDGMQYRKDIGHRALERLSRQPGKKSSAYSSAGVDIDAGSRAVNLMSAAVRSTYTPAVLGGIGSFGGLFDASALQGMRAPVLVASTDGVGTKIMLAAQAGSYTSIGQDIVNHCINDILVQGARPLFFLDYFASSRLKPEQVAEVVSGIAAACRAAGCALIGGETAEMPGVYAPGEFDLAGTIVGVLERDEMLPHPSIAPGDVLIGLASHSPHTNGYSLIRKIFADVPLDTVFPELGEPLGQVLLRPHRSYLNLLAPFLSGPASPIKALAHLTGGGFIENIPRVLPANVNVQLRSGSWPVPPLYGLIQKRGGVTAEEMARVFNLGIGMVAIMAPQDAPAFQKALGEESWVIGEIVPGERKVVLR
jgi:phosphoribosylamine--glycine ligase/phosphoribosylformylglycinamidine cyclo-ligase